MGLSFVLQAGICGFISLWGLAMVVLGIAADDIIWSILGGAVFVAGLPFVKNSLSSRGRVTN